MSDETDVVLELKILKMPRCILCGQIDPPWRAPAVDEWYIFRVRVRVGIDFISGDWWRNDPTGNTIAHQRVGIHVRCVMRLICRGG